MIKFVEMDENVTLAGQLQEEEKARIEYHQLGKSETQAAIDSAKRSCMDVLDAITKTLSTAAVDDEEEVCREAQYFRDHDHRQKGLHSK